MASVAFNEIHKSFGSTKVVHGISLQINDGEFMVLVGPSGCGKSTLLRMLAGLEDISAGSIAIDGRVVNDLESKDRDIAMVFQSYALYPHMTVRENMGFSLRLRNENKEVIEERVGKAAGILNLAPYLERYPRELSGGQRQRVAMGRAIVRDPKVFLFDEPLSNLDAKLRVAMRAEIKALHQRLKTTTVYVTHDQVEAMTMADRIAMNVFDGTLKNGSVESLGARWPAPQNRGSSGQAVKYGIRPEHLELGRDGVPAEVVVVEPMGHETELLVRINDIDLIVVMHGRSAHAPGERIFLAPQAANAHLFDAASGRRI
jgi:multiple sugar transport system ATP-binding protein